MFWIVCSLAAAAVPEAPEPTDIRVELRAMGESTDDPAIATVYGGKPLAGGVALALPLTEHLLLDAEIAVRRMALEGATDGLSLVPISAVVGWTGVGTVAPWIGIGPGVVAFSETYAPGSNGLGAISGARIVGEVRGGVRIDTGLVQPRMAPAPSPIRALELHLFAGRRMQRPGRDGFRLGAWRLGLGVGFRL